MKKLLTLILLSISIVGYSQIGLTESEIKTRYSNSTFESSFTTEGTRYISTQLKNGYMSFYFTDNVVEHYIIIPNNDTKLNGYIEYFNNNYVILSETTWRKYENNIYTNIVLKYSSKYKTSYFYCN